MHAIDVETISSPHSSEVGVITTSPPVELHVLALNPPSPSNRRTASWAGSTSRRSPAASVTASMRQSRRTRSASVEAAVPSAARTSVPPSSLQAVSTSESGARGR